MLTESVQICAYDELTNSCILYTHRATKPDGDLPHLLNHYNCYCLVKYRVSNNYQEERSSSG